MSTCDPLCHTFQFYDLDRELIERLPVQEVPCPGHPQYGRPALVLTFPEGTILVQRPTYNRPCASWRWLLPNGDSISCDYYARHGRLNFGPARPEECRP